MDLQGRHVAERRAREVNVGICYITDIQLKLFYMGQRSLFSFYIGDIIVLLKPLQWSGERQNWNKTEHRNIIYGNCYRRDWRDDSMVR